MRILLSQEIFNREDFGEFCNRHFLIGTAIEVGTDAAAFTIRFLEKWHGSTLYCIDPWDSRVEYWRGNWDRSPQFETAMHVLAPHNDRVIIFRGTSEEFVLGGADNSVVFPADFVYIDADHSYESVKRDIELFWPGVSERGVLAGHDYAGHWSDDVTRAVNEFAEEVNTNVYLTHEPVGVRSWYINKYEVLQNSLETKEYQGMLQELNSGKNKVGTAGHSC